MKEKYKNCSIHGELDPDKIWTSKAVRNGKTYVYYLCSICKKGRQYKTTAEKDADIASNTSWCGGCKSNCGLNSFTAFQLTRKPSYCNSCITLQNKKNWMKARCRADTISFKLTNSDFDTMLKNQNGACAICKNPESRIDRRSKQPTRLCVDHHHESGKVRGLLCFKCNFLIGNCYESADILQNAINYILEYKE